MKALILNSGLGSRMGSITKEHPKCMTEISEKDTILSRQLKLLCDCGVEQALITTGYYDTVLTGYCESLKLPIQVTFAKNEKYASTNYIYSIFCAREELAGEDILLMHGDLVFEPSVLLAVLQEEKSCVTVSSSMDLPEKDFKAVIQDGCVTKIGIEFFDNAVAAQPLYKLQKPQWEQWLENICRFCDDGAVNCYAENAFNEISDKCQLFPLDIKDKLCQEIDSQNDLKNIKRRLQSYE